MRVLMGCLVLACCVAADEKKGEKIDARKLVGKWELKDEGKKAGERFVAEYTKDGKLVMTAEADGKKEVVTGTYKLDGDKLTQSGKIDGKELATTMTVTRLTDTELVHTFMGEEQKFVRVKEEKIDPAKLVGKWEPKAKLKFAVVLEYTKEGKFIHTVTGDGPERRTACDYVVDGDRLNISERFDDGRESFYIDTVVSLTDTELVISKGPNRSNLRYVRIQDKK